MLFRRAWCTPTTGIKIRRLYSPSSSINFTYDESLVQRPSPDYPEMIEHYEDFLRTRELLPSYLRGLPKISDGRIFANDEYRFDEVTHVGFDVDYTLCKYGLPLLNWIYGAAVLDLVHDKGYPEQLLKLSFDPNFAIRGLSYDMETGCVLKLDASFRPQDVFFGRRQLSKAEVEELYPSHSKLRHNPRLVMMADLFCLPEVNLLSDVIDLLERLVGNTFNAAAVFQDVHAAVESLHRSRRMHEEIMRNVSKYVLQSPETGLLLKRLHEGGRELFVLSNSHFTFVDRILGYLLKNTPGVDHYSELFTYIITSADKPSWFRQKRPFRRVDRETARLSWEPVLDLRRGKYFAHGSLETFTELSGAIGRNVVYLGDHLSADLQEPRSHVNWRTGLIVPELKKELEIQNQESYRVALGTLIALERMTAECQKLKHVDLHALERWSQLRQELRESLKRCFNPYFGSVFRTHYTPTSYAHLVNRYADIYTADLCNLLSIPLGRKFSLYPTRGFLPHEQGFILPWECGVNIPKTSNGSNGAEAENENED